MKSTINQVCKGLFLSLVTSCTLFVQEAKAWTGSAPANGQSYYLYNLYQEKFLSYGNSWGTQVSLDNSKPLLCTMSKSGSTWTINTHYSLSSQSYNANVNNYVFVSDGLPFVDANYGSSDTNFTSRTPQSFTISSSDDRGYYLTYTSSGTTQALMFGTGTACEIANLNQGFNRSKAEWLFITEAEYQEHMAKKRFVAASMNVDGMPKTIRIAGVYNYTLNPDAKESAGATAIGRKLVNMGYDFIGVSEDFNYNTEIMNEIGSIYNQGTHRGKIETSLAAYSRIISQTSPVFNIDGLNFFWNKEKATASNETWVRWNDHYGYTSDGADGLIAKGYRFYTITLEDGTQIDVYTLHMDAETSEGDNLARESQMTQLANAIIASNNGNPILIIGDTNCRYTRDRIKTLLIDRINADSRFTIKDAWIEHARGGIYPACGGNSIMASEEGYRKGEVVDKIFYINNTQSNVQIQAETYLQDLSFINDEGEPLADHWPCVIEFSYTTNIVPPVPEPDTTELSGIYYFRNVESGAFLKQGGWWGTHAVQGNYGSPMTVTPVNGKYVIQSNIGFLSQGDPYMDASTEQRWNITKTGNYYTITYNNNGTVMALTGNDTTTFPHGANTRYVTCAPQNTNDDYQKWELLTAEDLLAEMAYASENNPMNITHLLYGANFDRNDTEGRSHWVNSITPDASKMSYNLSGGLIEDYNGNPCAEVYISSYSGWTTYATTWEISQTITGVPNGHYRVTCQAFYRDGNMNQNNPGTIHTRLYAGTGANATSKAIASIYSAHCTTPIGAGNRDKDGYYIPDGMEDASGFFNAGYYNNTLEFNVTDGTIRIAIGKPTTTKSTSSWTCFDNFQIEYLGTTYYEAPARINTATSISELGNNTEGAEFYNLNGTRTNSLNKGVNIIRTKNGDTIKIMK